MAFVYKAERFDAKEQVKEIGPGAYDLRKDLKARPGYAPFGSTAPRYVRPKETKKTKGKVGVFFLRLY
jgi:hypothetical protein